MEHYVYWGIVIQMVLITSHLLWDWPNLYFMLLPGMIIIGSYFVILAALLIGSLRINADQISKKRYQLGIAGLATLFLLLFLIHITDKFFRGKSVPDVLLCIEFLIPEVLYFLEENWAYFQVCLLLPISLMIIRAHRNLSPLLEFQNFDLLTKPAFIRSLVETQFDYRSRLRLLFYRENRVFRSLICAQLFQSFLQFPEISQSPFYARRIVETWKRRDHGGDRGAAAREGAGRAAGDRVSGVDGDSVQLGAGGDHQRGAGSHSLRRAGRGWGGVGASGGE